MHSELAGVAGIVGTAAAGELLAGRLTRRLTDQGGPGAVTDPVGWLIGRGLPRRGGCVDVRCDEGLRMDTGSVCASCTYLVADRRGLRHQVAAVVDAEMPTAAQAERKAVTERRLRERVAAEAERAAARREQLQTERAERQAAFAQAKAEAAAAEQARLDLRCEDCGTPDSAGLCSPCGPRRVLEEQLRSAALTAAAAHADLTDPADVDAVLADTEASIRTEIQTACDQARAEGATAGTLALLARLTAETAVGECRRSALAMLARTGEAEAEAKLAYEARMRSWHRYVTRSGARKAAAEAAVQARQRTAQHLLNTRLATLRSHHGCALEAAGHSNAARPAKQNWAERLAPLASRPLSEDLVS
ncbi:hypothetical protein ACFYRC_37880 [Streptomyces sp. NPDC005279]|uniref:hypothetical protein n=1 Tax=Streptomyces sp. NPDC005279 TaxID=3364712 RepID=UPI0036836DA7